MNEMQQVIYLYRDAGNYKFWGAFLVAGQFSLSDLSQDLLHGQYFVPELIGIPSLVPRSRNDDDHMLHEFDSIKPIGSGTALFTARELIHRVHIANVAGWFNVAGACYE